VYVYMYMYVYIYSCLQSLHIVDKHPLCADNQILPLFVLPMLWACSYRRFSGQLQFDFVISHKHTNKMSQNDPPVSDIRICKVLHTLGMLNDLGDIPVCIKKLKAMARRGEKSLSCEGLSMYESTPHHAKHTSHAMFEFYEHLLRRLDLIREATAIELAPPPPPPKKRQASSQGSKLATAAQQATHAAAGSTKGKAIAKLPIPAKGAAGKDKGPKDEAGKQTKQSKDKDKDKDKDKGKQGEKVKGKKPFTNVGGKTNVGNLGDEEDENEDDDDADSDASSSDDEISLHSDQDDDEDDEEGGLAEIGHE
jgi:hypothetical protein